MDITSCTKEFRVYQFIPSYLSPQFSSQVVSCGFNCAILKKKIQSVTIVIEWLLASASTTICLSKNSIAKEEDFEKGSMQKIYRNL